MPARPVDIINRRTGPIGEFVTRFVVLGLCVLAFALTANRQRRQPAYPVRPIRLLLPMQQKFRRSHAQLRAVPTDFDLSGKSVHLPFDLQFKFQRTAVAASSRSSFHLIYLKSPTVDLTARVRPYIQATGLVMPQAEAPAGRHVIEARISDSDRREAVGVFTSKWSINTCGSAARQKDEIRTRPTSQPRCTTNWHPRPMQRLPLRSS